jgi:hypothetical protein
MPQSDTLCNGNLLEILVLYPYLYKIHLNTYSAPELHY